MTTINQLDLQLQLPQGILYQQYSSTTVCELLQVQQGYTLTDHLPTPAQGPVADWGADELIATLQRYANAIATQLNTTGDTSNAQPMLYRVRQESVTTAELTDARVDEVRYYTQDGVAMVEYMALGNPRPAADSNPGYQDLGTLIAFLEAGRNAGAQLLNVSTTSQQDQVA